MKMIQVGPFVLDDRKKYYKYNYKLPIVKWIYQFILRRKGIIVSIPWNHAHPNHEIFRRCIDPAEIHNWLNENVGKQGRDWDWHFLAGENISVIFLNPKDSVLFLLKYQ